MRAGLGGRSLKTEKFQGMWQGENSSVAAWYNDEVR